MNAAYSSRIRSHHPRFRARLLSGALLSTVAMGALAQTAGFPAPTPHSQQAYDPESSFTMHWTRADIRQIKAQSHTATAADKNSLPTALTMPDIPQDFPLINPNVWVWDTWSLADMRANQLAYKGWEVIFSLTADPHAGYTFDDRHVHARIGFFYRRAGVPAALRPANGGWTWGGHLFPDGASVKVFGTAPMTDNAEWSGSARLINGNHVSLYYTALSFNRSAPGGSDITPPIAIITRTDGQIHADDSHVWFSGFGDHQALLQPDGTMYQTGQQNTYYSFRDPFVFTDPAHPGKTYMVFEGNTGGPRGARTCTEADLGYAPNDPYREDLNTVMNQGAVYQKANVGLAVATDKQLTLWKFLPPLLSANCGDDQTERPQIYMKDGKYYLFTISHRATMAAGVDGPDGVYGFVGNGIRSDFLPMNKGSGLVLGNPTDFDAPVGAPYAQDPNQNPRTFQSYSHYVMPGGLVESFIDAIGTRRGGTLAPTVKISINGDTTTVDRTYGKGGLGGYGDIPANQSAPGNGNGQGNDNSQ
ncbi:glycoside hydrolase family 68 protein [Paraburkholderia hospita]|uniref:glycoside hydrolase family 68 protein n=1 Tax=Paraburkholderia hospita TaxID=169430 RepID=UPI0009A90680|nr:Levansucrase/Invertase [Paraburkholderia hospita]